MERKAKQRAYKKKMFMVGWEEVATSTQVKELVGEKHIRGLVLFLHTIDFGTLAFFFFLSLAWFLLFIVD